LRSPQFCLSQGMTKSLYKDHSIQKRGRKLPIPSRNRKSRVSSSTRYKKKREDWTSYIVIVRLDLSNTEGEERLTRRITRKERHENLAAQRPHRKSKPYNVIVGQEPQPLKKGIQGKIKNTIF